VLGTVPKLVPATTKSSSKRRRRVTTASAVLLVALCLHVPSIVGATSIGDVAGAETPAGE